GPTTGRPGGTGGLGATGVEGRIGGAGGTGRGGPTPLGGGTGTSSGSAGSEGGSLLSPESALALEGDCAPPIPVVPVGAAGRMLRGRGRPPGRPRLGGGGSTPPTGLIGSPPATAGEVSRGRLLGVPPGGG